MAIDINERAGSSPGASGLWHSLNSFLGTLLTIAHTRAQLLTTELEEEAWRVAKLLACGLVALLAAMMALLLGALTIIVAFWETHRLLAALSMTVLFLVLALAAVWMLRAQLKTRPRLLEHTLAELAKDRDRVRQKL